MLENSALEPALPASDLDRAKGWYLDKLGLSPVEENDYGELVYQSGGASFMVYASGVAGTNQATAARILLPNFDEVVEQLRSRGVVFEELDFGDWGKTVDGVISSADGKDKSAWFKDSEGNIINIYVRG